MKQSKSNKSNEVITFYIVILSLSYSLHFSTGITCNSTRLLFQSNTYIIQFLYIYNCISKAHSLQFHHHACAAFHYRFPLNCTAIGYQNGYYWSLSTTIQCPQLHRRWCGISHLSPTASHQVFRDGIDLIFHLHLLLAISHDSDQ